MPLICRGWVELILRSSTNRGNMFLKTTLVISIRFLIFWRDLWEAVLKESLPDMY